MARWATLPWGEEPAGSRVHGKTVATNNPRQEERATAVLTTARFRDVLEVGRGNRTILSDTKAARPAFVGRTRNVVAPTSLANADGPHGWTG